MANKLDIDLPQFVPEFTLRVYPGKSDGLPASFVIAWRDGWID
jgi:hypothetical protein